MLTKQSVRVKMTTSDKSSCLGSENKIDNFENIIKKVALRVTPVQEKYENMQERFKAIMTQCMQKANQGSLLTNQ